MQNGFSTQSLQFLHFGCIRVGGQEDLCQWVTEETCRIGQSSAVVTAGARHQTPPSFGVSESGNHVDCPTDLKAATELPALHFQIDLTAGSAAQGRREQQGCTEDEALQAHPGEPDIPSPEIRSLGNR